MQDAILVAEGSAFELSCCDGEMSEFLSISNITDQLKHEGANDVGFQRASITLRVHVLSDKMFY